MELIFELGEGEVVRMHIGTFFGIYDLNILTKSKGKIILAFDEEPIDLIEQSPASNASPVPKKSIIYENDHSIGENESECVKEDE